MIDWRLRSDYWYFSHFAFIHLSHQSFDTWAWNCDEAGRILSNAFLKAILIHNKDVDYKGAVRCEAEEKQWWVCHLLTSPLLRNCFSRLRFVWKLKFIEIGIYQIRVVLSSSPINSFVNKSYATTDYGSFLCRKQTVRGKECLSRWMPLFNSTFINEWRKILLSLFWLNLEMETNLNNFTACLPSPHSSYNVP